MHFYSPLSVIHNHNGSNTQWLYYKHIEGIIQYIFVYSRVLWVKMIQDTKHEQTQIEFVCMCWSCNDIRQKNIEILNKLT
jgi:hypothetical protein